MQYVISGEKQEKTHVKVNGVSPDDLWIFTRLKWLRTEVRTHPALPTPNRPRIECTVQAPHTQKRKPRSGYFVQTIIATSLISPAHDSHNDREETRDSNSARMFALLMSKTRRAGAYNPLIADQNW